MEVEYDPDAYEEGILAAEWYEARDPGLGARFAIEWKRVEKDVSGRPEFHRCRHGSVRACNFKIFPYRILYRILGSRIQVLAVMHHAREPGYWKSRGTGK